MAERSIEHRCTLGELRSTARGIQVLTAEADDLEAELELLVARHAPDPVSEPGVGTITAQILNAWSHAGRVRSEAAFAMLSRSASIPASSGQIVRHRLNRGGDRQLNRALRTLVLSRMRFHPETRAYVTRRTAGGAHRQRPSAASSATSPDASSDHSRADPTRNRHRATSGGAWSKHAIRAILQNPRYTGHQVWNRQRRDEVLIDIDEVALGHETKMRWNSRNDWVWSERPTHEAIITPDQFDTARRVFVDVQRPAVRREKTKRGPYVLSGLMRCSVCGRRMQGSWNHGQAYYRCAFPAEYAVSGGQHAKTIYVKESAITPALDGWLAQLFDDEHLEGTCAALEAATALPPVDDTRELAARRAIRECDDKLAKYRKAIEAGTDPAIVGGWIEEVKLQRKAAELDLRRIKQPDERLTREEIRSLVTQLKGIVAILAQADPEDRRAVYQQLDISVTYHPDGQLQVSAGSSACTNECVGGASRTRTRQADSGWLTLVNAA